jgi:hypothetical protein
MYKNLEKGELRKKNKKKLEDEGRISEKKNELEQRNNKKKRK